MDAVEEQSLKEHWSRMSRDFLDSYLVQAEENPAINPQSVFIRGCLVDRLFTADFGALINEEIAYSACACHALRSLEDDSLAALVEGAENQKDAANTPRFISKLIDDDARGFDPRELFSEIAKRAVLGFEHFDSPFETRWKNWLKGRKGERFQLLEVGCGSANDYRYWHAYGLTNFFDYVGVDICDRNIENAKRRFPAADFRAANGCALDEEDQSFDVTLCFDVLEHLSAEGVEDLLNELTRLSRDEVWISLFNGTLAETSEYTRQDDYHWNTLSVFEIAEFMSARGFSCTVMSIATELESRFADYAHYNAGACLLLAKREERA